MFSEKAYVKREAHAPAILIMAVREDTAGMAAGPPERKTVVFMAREGRVPPRPHWVRP